MAGVNFSPAAPWATVMNSPLVTWVTPSLRYSVPPVMFVIWKLVTKAVSAALGVITRPEVVCVLSVVVALVTVGWFSTRLTVIVAVAVGPPSPAVVALVDSCTVKLPEAVEFRAGVNFSPAAPWATVMNSPLVIWVMPSLRYSVPPVMFVIWKSVTKAVSAALGVITRPEVVCVFSVVVALVTVG